MGDSSHAVLKFAGVGLAVAPYWMYVFAGMEYQAAMLWAVCAVSAFIMITDDPDA